MFEDGNGCVGACDTDDSNAEGIEKAHVVVIDVVCCWEISRLIFFAVGSKKFSRFYP